MPKRIFLKENVVVGSNPPGGYKSLELNTSGDLSLKSSGGTVSAVSGGSDIFVFKTSSQDDSSNTLVNDTELFFTALANSTYIVNTCFILNVNDSSGYISAKIDTTNSPDVYGDWILLDRGSGGQYYGQSTPVVTDTVIYVADESGTYSLNNKFLIKTSTESLITVQFKSDGSTTATMNTGSYLHAQKVA
jgi:hypothetical protein